MVDISDVANADVIRLVASIRFVAPPTASALFPKWGFGAECVVKGAVEHFTVNSVTGLGFPPSLSFPVTFAGQLESPGGGAPGQPPIYKWTVNEQIGQDIILGGTQVRVNGLDGVARSFLYSTSTFHGVACDGSPRTFRSLFGETKGFGEGFYSDTDLTLHIVVQDVAIDIPIALNTFFGFLGIAQRHIPRVSIPRAEAIGILTPGVRADASGYGFVHGHVTGIPPGPSPFESALDDAIVGLAIAKLGVLVGEKSSREAVQRAAIQAAMGAIDRLRESLSLE